ncbi:phosphoribosylglycinamide formyltransferase [Sinanaerobacter chloroacetimidivorans]|uniref:phosphoribosylglycinamide formyltransferase n=1 Tax=Sinanaerobacter chloroacetimidivorans TaxID=2818044 RepID=UPI001D056CBD|nr:phosphoribosylglycinamide formyltransferase [Sinanaerobacter chloroacetimidivorans]
MRSHEKLKISVLVSGGGTNLQSVIDHIESGYLDKAKIVRVISSNCDAFALKRAENHNIKGVCISKEMLPDPKERCAAIMKELEAAGTDLIILAGYMSILEPELIDRYRDKIVNIHPSLIPKYCGKGFYGRKVHAAVLAGNELASGATVHFVDEGVDTGKIILQEQVPVKPGDTPETLANRVLQIEHRILPEAIKMLCDGKLK